MAQFKITQGQNDTRNLVGTANTYEKAVTVAYDWLHRHGGTQGDKPEDVISALTDRGYYTIGYGPSDISIEEC